MGVRRETVEKPTAKFSSGERAKVLLASIILGDNNLLVLDEPTNHLDVETQDVLLDSLRDFPGGYSSSPTTGTLWTPSPRIRWRSG